MRNPPKPINACRTVADLLADPGRWGKQTPWKRDIRKAKPLLFDVMDAIEFIYVYDSDQVIARRALRIAAGVKGTLTKWNDAPERTHKEVLDAVKKAGI